MQRNYVLIILGLSFVSNITCNYVSKYFGSRKFVQYVMPSLRLEGVIVSILMSALFGYFFFLIAEKTEGEFLIAKIEVDEYLLFGITTGFLTLMGNLLTQFLKRCANMKFEDDNKRTIISADESAFVQIWHSKNVLNQLSGFLLPTCFIFWYATMFLRPTMEEDPLQYSIFTLIKTFER